ncbi:MAG: DNA primase [Pirellulales bacterium]
MSLTSSLDTKEQVRAAVDIVELVGGQIPLRRQGRGYVGSCPWHDDRRPSLQVNPERQTWKCWVCDIGGDIFSFVMQREGVEFREALSMLAERAGIELQHSRVDATGGPPPAATKQRLYQAAAWVEHEYHQCLLESDTAEPARRYLDDRQIHPDSIRRFKIGFAPNQWDWLLRRVSQSEFTPQDLERIGAVGTSAKTGRRYDRFRGRLLFSIRDVQGRPIALGGRILPNIAQDEVAKYVNTADTPLFVKSGQLYGLDLARDVITKSQPRHAVVMEGYTDVVMAHQFGLDNTLAVLGTALGERHVQLLSRFADRITLVLDGDEAGQRRANEILNLFIASQLDLRVLTLPDGLDPCDFLLQHGGEGFRAALEAAPDALQHKIQAATRGIDPGTGSHEANRALEDILVTLAQAPRLRTGAALETKLREDQFLSRLCREFRAPEATVRARLTDMRREPRFHSRRPENRKVRHDKPKKIADRWEGELIEIILQEPESIAKMAESIRPDQLADPVARALYAECCRLANEGIQPALDRLLLQFDDPALKNLLVELDQRGRDRGGSDLVEQLEDVLASLLRRNEDAEHMATTAALKEKRFDEGEEVVVLQQLLEQKRARQQAAE